MSHNYTLGDVLNALNLLEDNPHPYDYCEVARRTGKYGGEYRVWPKTQQEIAKDKERYLWFDLLPETSSADIVEKDLRPKFGDSKMELKRKTRMSTLASARPH